MPISICVFKHVQLHVCMEGCMHVYLNMCMFMFRGQTLVRSSGNSFLTFVFFFETGCLTGLELTKTD